VLVTTLCAPLWGKVIIENNIKCCIPFTTVVLTEYSHHALNGAEDGTMNNDRTFLFTFVISAAATYKLLTASNCKYIKIANSQQNQQLDN